MCQVLHVARSGYYAWRHRKPCTRTQEKVVLQKLVKVMKLLGKGANQAATAKTCSMNLTRSWTAPLATP